MNAVNVRAPLDTATLRALAAEFSVHPASLAKAVAGGTVRGLAGHRIREGLERKGLSYLAPHLVGIRLGSFPDRPGVVVADDSNE